MHRVFYKVLLVVGFILAACGFFIVTAIVLGRLTSDSRIEPASDCEERLIISVSKDVIWVNDNNYEVTDIEKILNDLAMQSEKHCLLLMTTDDYDAELMAKVKHYADINEFDTIIMSLPVK